jgi:hypothetical protein
MELKYFKSFKGQIITNQPPPDYNAIETGKYFIDFYGCWHECKRRDKTIFYMIGEYPEHFNLI